jgi:2-polyprenyl-3-methyl-5-hydroxy-6-metoxy-1,4-benzoquinol methylase
MNNVDMQAKDVSDFFSNFANAWDFLYDGKQNLFMRWFNAKFRRDIYERYQLTFLHLGNDLTGKSILDIGCGSGVYSFEAARRGASAVVGIDVAEGMISLCNRRAHELGLSDRIKFINGKFPLSPLPAELSQKFDYAVVMGVMDYINDPLPFLTSLREMVSGYVMISFPGKEWLRWQLRRWRYKLMGRCTIWHYDELDVRRAMSQSGFRRFDITYLNHSGGCYFVKAEI